MFVVKEQAKVQVKEVRFIGNANLSTDELHKVMQTREGGLLSFLSDAGTYRDEALQRDLQALQALYLDRGYVTIKVGTPSVALSPDRRWIYVTIPVEEGEQYTIGKIAFDGQLLDQQARLRGLLRTKSGRIFSRSDVAADLFAIGDVYKDLGHAYANVTPLTNTDPEKRIVDLTFEVQPGKVVSFERIEIVGNEKTRDKVIRRELRVYEGERFSGTGMRSSRQRVNALGFFESAEITTKPGSADDKIVATVEVKERPTGTFQVGAGFSSYENFILTGQVSQQNFFGWGQTLSLQVQWSKIRQLGQIQFVEPYFLDTRWTFAFDVYMTEGIYTTFTRRSVGGSLTWGYELSGLERWWSFAKKLEDMRIFATYTNERVDVTAAAGQSRPPEASSSPGTTSSVRLSFQWDKRDNRLFPTNGFFLALSAEAAPPALAPNALFGNQVNLFTRYSFDARAYRPVWKGLVARAKLTLGLIRDWDAAHPVPISELFYVGGINSVRGYRYLSISPRRAVGDVVVAGRRDAAADGRRRQAGDPELRARVPDLRRGRHQGSRLLRLRELVREGDVLRPGGPALPLQVGRVRAPLVQPDRPAPLRVGLPAQPAEGPGHRVVHRPAARLPVHDRELLLAAAQAALRKESTMSHSLTKAVVLALALAPALAHAEQKLGYVDLQRALNEVDEGKAAKALLKRDFDEKQKQLDVKKTEFDKLQSDAEKQSVVMSDSAKKEKANELERRARELQGLFMQLQKDLSDREREATKGIFERMANIVREIAEADGFSMVLEKGAGVVYAPPSLDLTNELIRKYNARHPAAGGGKKDGAAKKQGEGKAAAPAAAKK